MGDVIDLRERRVAAARAANDPGTHTPDDWGLPPVAELLAAYDRPALRVVR